MNIPAQSFTVFTVVQWSQTHDRRWQKCRSTVLPLGGRTAQSTHTAAHSASIQSAQRGLKMNTKHWLLFSCHHTDIGMKTNEMRPAMSEYCELIRQDGCMMSNIVTN